MGWDRKICPIDKPGIKNRDGGKNLQCKIGLVKILMKCNEINSKHDTLHLVKVCPFNFMRTIVNKKLTNATFVQWRSTTFFVIFHRQRKKHHLLHQQ